MKTRHLLIAALLLGGMTAFNACSDKDEVDNIIPPVDQPAEELDTYLAFTSGFGDKVATKAESDPENGYDHKYQKIVSYAQAVFAVKEDGSAGSLLTFSMVGDGKNDFFSGDASSTGSDGLNLKPMKFKLPSNVTNVAVLILANCHKIFEAQEESSEIEGTTISDYATFSKYVNDKGIPVFNEDGSFYDADVYPMSSNLIKYKIEPGYYNAIGYDSESDAIKAFTDQGHSETAVTAASIKYENNHPIYLFRCWSLISLQSITVKKYNDDVDEAKFEVESAFLMNVPSKIKFFDDTESYNWNAWGGEVNFSIEGYDSYSTRFFSGYEGDKDNDDKDYSDDKWGKHSDDPSFAYDRGFRTKKIADITDYNEFFTRSAKEKLEISSIEGEQFIYSLFDAPSGINMGGSDQDLASSTFITSPSYYGSYKYSVDKNRDGQLTDQAMILVVKGKYSQRKGNIWFGAGNSSEDGAEIQSSYYTVLINDDDSKTNITDNGLLTPNRLNTVMRNVKYDLSLTVAGPGSDTPVLHPYNSYLTTKVKIVPFGTVKQSTEVD